VRPTFGGMEHAPWIVVGTDFSEAAGRALELAVERAAAFKASLACVHAVEAPRPEGSLDPTPTLLSRLAEIVARTEAADKGVHVELFVRVGVPWEQVDDVAAELGALLIVVGAIGAHSAERALGGVTNRLAATSTRPVLVAPAESVQSSTGRVHRVREERSLPLPRDEALSRIARQLEASLSELVLEARRRPALPLVSADRIARAIVDDLRTSENKLRIVEAATVRYALSVSGGSQSGAARLLGIGRRALGRRMIRPGSK
jgi:nucleotide-binding universal stress UspA family protein